ncbi:uncharacterized protein EV422DRAFT_563039 [Fimicolochytrium jonesii]|uniref:uncharacterized protein n=1 Tax=Fimicolochytrium jonesii TaxID=1396493 RepID=UPI0022FDC25F|nr:uncharacterized protein EV422DRAFT_563039 [Fimicolochytrium jonesii]KAI8826955.1 hypothetical protein EV422DRAFT_563039 [Fimicolochytrium jonesii]
MKIDGKVAIVTGASSGFGRALAWRLAGKGAKVVLGDISDAAGTALEKEINAKYPGQAIFRVCDVTSKADQQRLFEAAKTKWGSIDIVVNNAGIGESKQFDKDEEDIWVKVLRIDLEAVIIGTRLALTEMIAAGKGGVIVNTASLAGLYPQWNQPVYAAAKGGVVHFTRSVGEFAKRHGIHINAICPGFSPTGILVSAEKTLGPLFMKATQDRVPVEQVIDAFIMSIEDDTLYGQSIRITKQLGIDLYKWRSAKSSL